MSAAGREALPLTTMIANVCHLSNTGGILDIYGTVDGIVDTETEAAVRFLSRRSAS